jgi:hypothetical protein
MTLCALNPFLDPEDALAVSEWYVQVEDGEPVGPVSVNQIARGIRAGKVPEDARIARSGGEGWEEVLDSEAVIAALKGL